MYLQYLPLYLTISVPDENPYVPIPSSHRYQISQTELCKITLLQSVKKEDAVKRVRISQPPKSDKLQEEKDKYIKHYNTPKPSPEPSPVKKKIKESPTQEVSNSTENESSKNDNITNKVEAEKVKIDHGPEGVTNTNSMNNVVANEVVKLVQNLHDEIKGKSNRIKFLESKKKKKLSRK